MAATDMMAGDSQRSEEGVPRYGIFEMALDSECAYANPFMDVNLQAVFTAPGQVMQTAANSPKKPLSFE